jgi:hypothetical protein
VKRDFLCGINVDNRNKYFKYPLTFFSLFMSENKNLTVKNLNNGYFSDDE